MGYFSKLAALLVATSAGVVGSAKPSADAPGILGLRGLINGAIPLSTEPSRWTTEALARPRTPSPVNPPPQKPPLNQPGTPPPPLDRPRTPSPENSPQNQPGTPAQDQPGAKPLHLVTINSTNSNQTPAPVNPTNTSPDYNGAFIATGVLSFFYCIVSLSLKEGCNIHPMSILTKYTSTFIQAISNILGASESPLHTPRGESPLPPPQESPPPLPPPQESPPSPRGGSPLPPPQGLPHSAQPPIISSAPHPPIFGISAFRISATLGFDTSNSEQQPASAQLGFAPPNPSPAILTGQYPPISLVAEQNGRSV